MNEYFECNRRGCSDLCDHFKFLVRVYERIPVIVWGQLWDVLVTPLMKARCRVRDLSVHAILPLCFASPKASIYEAKSRATKSRNPFHSSLPDSPIHPHISSYSSTRINISSRHPASALRLFSAKSCRFSPSTSIPPSAICWHSCRALPLLSQYAHFFFATEYQCFA
jgi:hypothetical protein